MRLVALALTLALAGCFAPPFPGAPTGGAGHGQSGASAAHDAASEAMGLRVEGVCFETRVGGDEASSWIKGTRFAPAQLTGRERAILLQPGAASLGHIFDGESIGYGRENGTTLPRVLSRAGYVVVTIDRLGTGESPYDGPGDRLTRDAAVAATHDIVTALRAGSHLVGVAHGEACPAGTPAEAASSSVIVGGQSLGGGIAMTYATRHDDLDGLLVLQAHNRPINEDALRRIGQCIGSELPETYTRWFCPGPGGVSEDCALHFFHATRAPSENVRAICANDELHAEPIASFTTAAEASTRTIEDVPNVADIPVHFVHSEFDSMIEPGADGSLGLMAQIEVAHWQENCACDVTATTIPDIGHVSQFHDNYQLVNDDVLAWLRASGLDPTVAR